MLRIRSGLGANGFFDRPFSAYSPTLVIPNPRCPDTVIVPAAISCPPRPVASCGVNSPAPSCVRIFSPCNGGGTVIPASVPIVQTEAPGTVVSSTTTTPGNGVSLAAVNQAASAVSAVAAQRQLFPLPPYSSFLTAAPGTNFPLFVPPLSRATVQVGMGRYGLGQATPLPSVPPPGTLPPTIPPPATPVPGEMQPKLKNLVENLQKTPFLRAVTIGTLTATLARVFPNSFVMPFIAGTVAAMVTGIAGKEEKTV